MKQLLFLTTILLSSFLLKANQPDSLTAKRLFPSHEDPRYSLDAKADNTWYIYFSEEKGKSDVVASFTPPKLEDHELYDFVYLKKEGKVVFSVYDHKVFGQQTAAKQTIDRDKALIRKIEVLINK